MVARRTPTTMTPTSDSPGTLVASLFFPFWRLDAKGGEVVLVAIFVGFAWVGHKLICFRDFFACLCPFILVLNLFGLCV